MYEDTHTGSLSQRSQYSNCQQHMQQAHEQADVFNSDITWSEDGVSGREPGQCAAAAASKLSADSSFSI